MHLDQAFIARVQFAFTVSFHIIFPTISIGLASFLAIVEGLWLEDQGYPLDLQIYRFWLGIFAMAFGVGVVTGIVLFDSSSVWALLSSPPDRRPGDRPNDRIGGADVFLLEAGFLGIMLFGFRRGRPEAPLPRLTCMVALGTLLSASWILSANSWMQSPGWRHLFRRPLGGDELAACDRQSVMAVSTAAHAGGRVPYRVISCRGRWRLGIYATWRAPGVRPAYHPHGHGVRGGFDRRPGVRGRPALWANARTPAVENAGGGGLLGEAVTVAGSLLLAYRSGPKGPAKPLGDRSALSRQHLVTHSLTGRVAGLKNTPPDRQPNMAMVFYGFRVMYGIAIIMFAVAIASLWLRWRGQLFTTRWYLRALVWMSPSGVFATLGGWYPRGKRGASRGSFLDCCARSTQFRRFRPVRCSRACCAFVVVYRTVHAPPSLSSRSGCIRRGPANAPDGAEASGSLKGSLSPQILEKLAP